MDFPALLSLLISCQCFLLLCNKIKQYFNKKRKATASEIKKKTHAQEACLQQTSQNTGPLKQGYSMPNSLVITVTSYLIPTELTERCSGKKTQCFCPGLGMQSEVRQTTIGAIQQKRHRSVYSQRQAAAGRLALANTMPH